jgi:dynein heavy chain
MYVGNTGTGKTAIMMNKLSRMDPEATMFTTINMNSFSDAPSLQVCARVCMPCMHGLQFTCGTDVLDRRPCVCQPHNSQVMMEQPLEKKSGVRYGPPGARR